MSSSWTEGCVGLELSLKHGVIFPRWNLRRSARSPAASAPDVPAAAARNDSRVRAKQSSRTAMYSSFFDPNRRKRYGCEMPALRAIVSVDAPWRPRSANSTFAAARTAMRRSSAVCLVVVVCAIACKLALTHIEVKTFATRSRPPPRSSSSRTGGTTHERMRVGAGSRPERDTARGGAGPRPDLRLDAGARSARGFVAAIQLTTYARQPWRSPSAADGVSTMCSRWSGTSRRRSRVPTGAPSSLASCGMPIAQRRSGSR